LIVPAARSKIWRDIMIVVDGLNVVRAMYVFMRIAQSLKEVLKSGNFAVD
jgi:hypothetical protein